MSPARRKPIADARTLWGLARWPFVHPIGRRHPVRTLSAVVGWQWRTRRDVGPHVVPFVDSARLLVEGHEHGTTANIYVGLREFDSMGLLLHVLRTGDTFVDVGANVGTFTVLASAVRRARTVAVEPVPRSATKLVANVELNDCTDLVELHRLAVGAERSRAAITVEYGPGNRILPSGAEDAGARTVDVEVVPLDEVLGGRSATMLKIDVEGLEVAVLRGAVQALSDPGLRLVMVETNGSSAAYGGSDSDIVGMLTRDHGFAMATYEPWTRTVRRTGHPSSTDNTFFVRDLNWITERVRSAPPFTVKGHLI